jgi:hypothetical protein
MNKRTTTALLTMLVLAASAGVQAKEKKINIKENSSGLPAALSDSIAQTSVSMGVKEPISISRSGDSAVVSGSTGTVCRIKLSSGDNPNIMGISCK